MNSQFKKGVLELCVLHTLCKEDMYGYLIVSTISSHIDVSDNTIYPLLHRLAKEDYCETYLKESTDGPARKYYKITRNGKERLDILEKEWHEFTKKVSYLLGDE